MGKQLPENLQTTINDIVAHRVSAEIKQIKERLRYFFYGLGIFVVIVIGLGLFTELEIMRSFHDRAFPPIQTGQIGISYESVIRLQNDDPLQQVGTITFYAEPEQEVKLYLKFVHQFTGNLDRRKVIVMIDQNEIDEGPMVETTADFHSITSYLRSSSFILAENVHTISFSLDDTQSPELTDEITIHCIILVYEGET